MITQGNVYTILVKSVFSIIFPMVKHNFIRNCSLQTLFIFFPKIKCRLQSVSEPKRKRKIIQQFGFVSFLNKTLFYLKTIMKSNFCNIINKSNILLRSIFWNREIRINMRIRCVANPSTCPELRDHLVFPHGGPRPSASPETSVFRAVTACSSRSATARSTRAAISASTSPRKTSGSRASSCRSSASRRSRSSWRSSTSIFSSVRTISAIASVAALISARACLASPSSAPSRRPSAPARKRLKRSNWARISVVNSKSSVSRSPAPAAFTSMISGSASIACGSSSSMAPSETKKGPHGGPSKNLAGPASGPAATAFRSCNKPIRRPSRCQGLFSYLHT
nr:Uvs067 [uncultured bacterium]